MLLCTPCIWVTRKFHLPKMLQNGAKFIQKLTPAFKNHMRNLNNFKKV